MSVVITTFNEQEHIVALLANVAWADEIIVVDSFSSDNTLTLLQANPKVRLFQRSYEGPAEQKNWAIEQATHPWILLMDADERISPELMTEIDNWRQQEPWAQAYTIRFRTHFMGHAVRYSGWQNDKAVRLIRKDCCRYNQNQVHEDIDTKGLTVASMKHHFDHFTYKNLDHFLAKMQRYAQWGASDAFSKTKKVTYFHLFLKPIVRFFKHFVLKRGFLDGKVGFVISVFMAWGVFLRYVYLREKINKD